MNRVRKMQRRAERRDVIKIKRAMLWSQDAQDQQRQMPQDAGRLLVHPHSAPFARAGGQS